MGTQRQPRGIPVGGQFAQNDHDEAGTALTAATSVSSSDIRAGDVVDMTPLVSDYVANTFDGVLNDEDDGQDMLGTFTVAEASESGGVTKLTVTSPERTYEWYVPAGTPVPLVERKAPRISSMTGLASLTAGAPRTEQPMIGYSPDANLVRVRDSEDGSRSVEIAPGGALTLYPRDLPSLSSTQAYDRVTIAHRDGRMVAECEASAGNVGDAKDARHLDDHRAEIDQYLSQYGMRLPKKVNDWSQVTLIHDADIGGTRPTSDGRSSVTTSDIDQAVLEKTQQTRDHVSWAHQGRFAQGIRQHVGLPLR